MGKTITELINELEQENQKLKEFRTESEKIFEKALKLEFGINKKQIEKILSNSYRTTEFERKICEYFSLKSEQEKQNFLTVFCSESSLNYYKSKREKDSISDTEKQG